MINTKASERHCKALTYIAEHLLESGDKQESMAVNEALSYIKEATEVVNCSNGSLEAINEVLDRKNRALKHIAEQAGDYTENYGEVSWAMSDIRKIALEFGTFVK